MYEKYNCCFGIGVSKAVQAVERSAMYSHAEFVLPRSKRDLVCVADASVGGRITLGLAPRYFAPIIQLQWSLLTLTWIQVF